MAGNYILGL